MGRKCGSKGGFIVVGYYIATKPMHLATVCLFTYNFLLRILFLKQYYMENPIILMVGSFSHKFLLTSQIVDSEDNREDIEVW